MKAFQSPFDSSAVIAVPARRSPLARLGMVCACGLLVSFAGSPVAQAAAPDGQYKFASASGSIQIGSRSFPIDSSVAKQVANVKNGVVTITNSRVPLGRRGISNIADRLTRSLGDDVLDLTIAVTGPNSVVLKPSDGMYVGTTSRPVVVTLSGSFGGFMPFTGTLQFRCNAKVKGRTLTTVVPIRGDLLGQKINGRVTVVCKR